jgi:cysteine desulfurase
MDSTTTLIDLDHNATTRPSPEVIEVMDRAWRDAYGNPGSRHALGRRARQALESARETIAEILNASPREIVFTSGGTEATNLALLGLAEGRRGSIAAPRGEHPATEETIRTLEVRGWSRAVIPLDRQGLIQSADLTALPWDRIRIATVLLAHNETGVVQEVGPLAAACREHAVPLHIDAVQAVGKIDVDFRALGANTLALGAHKFHGPRGIGALLVREGTRLAPAAFGGHQEAGRRPGTECVPLAVGMAKALELWKGDRERRSAQLRALRDKLERGLLERCQPAVINGSREHRLPNTLSIAFPGCNGDALLVALDLAGVCCSLGSTCASGSSEPAPILVAMGADPNVARATLRFSVGPDNDSGEIDEAVQRIAHVVNAQRRSTDPTSPAS